MGWNHPARIQVSRGFARAVRPGLRRRAGDRSAFPVSCWTAGISYENNDSMITPELRGVRILAEMTNEQLDELLGFGQVLSIAPGQMIVNQGGRADAMFFLLEGKVSAYVTDASGGESPLRSTEGGGHFGEIGMLQHGIRTASVRAATHCRVFRLEQNSFQELLNRPALATPFLHGISKSLALRLADITNRLAEARSLKDAWLL